MDNFNYKAYHKSGKIYVEQAMLTESEQISEKKYKQGYDDREDESLGARRGAEKDKKQSMKDRRDESYGDWGKRGNQKINKKHGGHVSSRTKHIMDEKDEIRRVDSEIRRNEGYKKGGKVKK